MKLLRLSICSRTHFLFWLTKHNALAYLMEHQTPKLHLVITTCQDPPIPQPRWRARGELIEIREQDLRFTAAEATALFSEISALDLTNKLAFLHRSAAFLLPV